MRISSKDALIAPASAGAPVEVSMRIRSHVLAVLIAALLWSPTAWAQQTHVADAAAMQAALAKKVAAEDAQRQAVLEVLSHPQVRQVADQFGLTVKDARSAVAQLSGSELAELAEPTRALAAELTGGQNVIVISVTTLLLIIIIVLLIAD